MKNLSGFINWFSQRQKNELGQSVRSLNLSLDRLQDYHDISRLIVLTMVDTLGLSGGCLVVMNDYDYLEVAASQGTLGDSDIETALLKRLSPTRRSPATEFPNAAKAEDNVAFIVPLNFLGKETAVLCLASKSSAGRFSDTDCFFIREASAVAAAAMQRALLARKANIKNTFLSVASHEFNSPLTTIIGYTELLLRQDTTDSKEKKWLQQVYDSGKQMAAVVSNMLNVTRIQNGKFGLKIENAVFSDLLEEPLTLAKETGIKNRFEVTIEPDLPKMSVDRAKYSHIIWSLLSNAIKYSPKGSLIGVSVRSDNGHKRVVLSVRDEGMGIAPADQDALFKTFHRIHRPETIGIRGSGMGLYIVKEWTEAMGGEVWLESELNKGSTFYVAVPASNGDSPS